MLIRVHTGDRLSGAQRRFHAAKTDVVERSADHRSRNLINAKANGQGTWWSGQDGETQFLAVPVLETDLESSPKTDGRRYPSPMRRHRSCRRGEARFGWYAVYPGSVVTSQLVADRARRLSGCSPGGQ